MQKITLNITLNEKEYKTINNLAKWENESIYDVMSKLLHAKIESFVEAGLDKIKM